ncbi:MAG: 5-(carboxyamino)imidazole ribonucleotide mutase [Elusimicrobiales bacterium]|nr:5-(carboxyamino)imidazole ribonucleotide mutase [Elusimicrobiales bacterium]
MKRDRVSVIMGSDSDLPVMQAAVDQLVEFGVPYEVDIISAHRTPERLFEYAGGASARGIGVFIAGAGGAAHLPGMVAAVSALPVIGVPIRSSNSIDGWDSILSILQMPGGVPVATVALNGARNAGILAAQILSVGDQGLHERLLRFKEELREKGLEKSANLKS